MLGVAITILVSVVYGWVLLVSLTNLILMRRPGRARAETNFEVMIPARNEELRLPTLLAPLAAQGVSITVFDDESSDATAEIAAQFGARVIRPVEPLPEGWKGKPRACQALADVATADWVVFLDADTSPSEDFCSTLSAFLAAVPSSVAVVTGFPKMLPGRGLEPLYLFWVPWILLATNPYGLVARTRMGHNFFLNGQFSAWRIDTLRQLRPFEHVRNEVLDDVKIGRYLASKSIQVETIDLSRILSVKMYSDLSEAWRGMGKNAAYVIPGRFGPYFFAFILLALGWLWLFAPWAGLLLFASSLAVAGVVKMRWWLAFFVPISLTAGAVTAIVSAVKRSKGSATWKGRTL